MAFVGRTDVKDPGAQQDQWERLTRRRERLYAEDEQFQRTRLTTRSPPRHAHPDCGSPKSWQP